MDPKPCSLMNGKSGVASHAMALETTIWPFQSRKKNQQEKSRSTGSRKPRPMASGYAVTGNQSMAFHGLVVIIGFRSVMPIGSIGICG